MSREKRNKKLKKKTKNQNAIDSSRSYAIAGFRLRRDAGELIENAEKLSRIVGGVALEIGIMDGSIPPDKAIAELLRMGAVKLEDIGKLDPVSVDTLMADLKALPDANKETKPIEDRLVLLDYVRRNSEFMDTFSTFPGKKEYKEKLVLVEKLGTIDIQPLEQLKVDGAFLRKDLMEYGKYKDTLTEEQVKNVDRTFRSIEKNVESMEKIASMLKPTVVELTAIKDLAKYDNFLDLLYKENDIRDKIPKLRWVGIIDAIKKNFQSVKSVNHNLQSSDFLVNTIQSWIQARSSKSNSTHTGGLSNGPHDLEQLDQTSGDPWIGARVTNQPLVSKNLRKVFEPFGEIATILKRVDKDWEQVEAQPELDKVVKAYFSALGLEIDLQSVFDTFNAIEACEQLKGGISEDIKMIEPAKRQIDELNQKIIVLSTLDYITPLEDLTSLKNALKLTGVFDSAAATNIVTGLKKSTMFKPVLEILDRLGKDVPILLSSIKELPSLAKALVNDKTIETYFAAVNVSYNTDFYTCLQTKVGDKTLDAKEAILNLQKTRVDDNALSIAKSSIGKIYNAKSDLDNAKNLAGNLKNQNSHEAKVLKNSFKNYQEVSKNLGTGVQGLTAVQTASEAKGKLTPLLGNIPDIQKAASALSKQHQDSLKKLSDLEKTFAGIDQFQTTLNGIKKLRKKRNANFSSLQQVFQAVSAVPDFSADLDSIKKALDALNKATQDKFKEARDAMDTLEKLNLEFSKFAMTDPAGTLAAVDQFFTEYAKQLSIPPATVPSPGNQPGATAPILQGLSSSRPLIGALLATTTLSFSEQMKKPEYWGPTAAVAAVVVVGAIAGAITLYCCCCKEKKNKTPDAPLPNPDDSDDSNSGEKKKEGKDKREKRDVDKPPKDPKEPKEQKTQEDSKSQEVPPVLNISKEGDKPAPNIVIKEDAPSKEETKTKEQSKEVDKRSKEPAQPVLDLKQLFSLAIQTERQLHCQMLQQCRTVFEWCYGICEADGKDLVDDNYKDDLSQEGRATTVYCSVHNRPFLEGFGFYHVNYMVFENTWYMAQAPLDGTEIIAKQKKRNTLEKFVALLSTNGVGIVLMLCQFEEKNVNKCARYYVEQVGESIDHGMFTVATTDKDTNLIAFTEDTKKFTLWKLLITNNKDKTTHEVHVLVYTGWPDHGAPESPVPALEMIMLADSYKANVLVHCSAGIGRTGSLVSIKHGIRACIGQTIMSVSEIINEVRKYRWGAVQSPVQVTYVILCITKGLMDAAGVTYHDSYECVVYFHREMCRIRMRRIKWANSCGHTLLSNKKTR